MIFGINGGELKIESKTLGGFAESDGTERFINTMCAECLGGDGTK
jgi:hypothetical protein